MNDSRLQNLLEGFQDGTLDDDDCREFLAMFDDDDSLLSAFTAELQIGNALAALHVVDSGAIPLSVRDSLERSGAAIDISRRVRQQIESETQHDPDDVVRQNPVLRSHAMRWIAMGAVAALIMLAVFISKPSDTNNRDVVAVIHSARHIRGITVGDQLRSGQVLSLDEGRVRITFQSGARLAVEAPAELRLLGSNSAELTHGLATVRVPGEIKGFTLITPQQRVTDLGTSFGVKVDGLGETSVSVFEGEVELENRQRLGGGQAVAFTTEDNVAREIPYAVTPYLSTWQVSFGVEELVGDVRVAEPGERHAPGRVEDSDSLLLFPESENVLLTRGYVVDATEPGTYHRPFRKRTVALGEDIHVDSFLLQYHPVRGETVSQHQSFQGELHFDRPIVALILQKDLLDKSDATLALPAVDFSNIFRRGLNSVDTVVLSPDRRVLRVMLDVQNGVDQLRVLVASDENTNGQLESP